MGYSNASGEPDGCKRDIENGSATSIRRALPIRPPVPAPSVFDGFKGGELRHDGRHKGRVDIDVERKVAESWDDAAIRSLEEAAEALRDRQAKAKAAKVVDAVCDMVKDVIGKGA